MYQVPGGKMHKDEKKKKSLKTMKVSQVQSRLVIREKETYCIQNSSKRLLSIKRKTAYLGFTVLQLMPTTVQMFFKCRSVK